MDELKETGIEVLFVTMTSPKNSEDKILNGVRGLFAEYERAKIAERFRLGKLRKIKEGHLLVSEALYGYKYIPNDKEGKIHGHYEIDPYESKIIKMIFGWVAHDGMTIRGVVRKLQELNIKPRKSKRGVWSTSTLSTQLKNRAYIGEARWGSSYAVVPENPNKIEKYKKIKKSSRRIKPESEWYVVAVPAIIDKEIFEKARKQLDENFKLCQRNKKNEYLLGQRIFCECGCRRGGEGPQKGKHLYYRCNSRVLSFPMSTPCSHGGLNARIADELVWNKVSTLMSSPKLMETQLKRWMKNRKENIQNALEDITPFKKEMDNLKVQEDRYNKAFGAGLFDIETLKEYVTPIKERLSVLQAQILKIEEQGRQLETVTTPQEDEIKMYASKAVKGLKSLSFAQKREIVLSTIDRVVGTQDQLSVYGFIPVTSLLKEHVGHKTISRNRRTSECRKINALQRSHQEGRACC